MEGPVEGDAAQRRLPNLLWLDAAALGLWLVESCLLCGALLFVVPGFAEIFIQLDVTLPAPTRALLCLSRAFVNWWYVLIPLAVLMSAVPIAIQPGRSWPVYVLCGMLGFVLAIAGVMSVAMPIVKIQQVLAKRK
jgi:hypothetical protein